MKKVLAVTGLIGMLWQPVFAEDRATPVPAATIQPSAEATAVVFPGEQVPAQTPQPVAVETPVIMPLTVTAQPLTGTAQPMTISVQTIGNTSLAQAQAVTKPADPASGVKIIFDTSAINSLKLSWAKTPGVTFYYNVYRKEKSSYEDFSIINKLPFAAEEFVDETINTGMAYTYRVEFRDLTGNAYMTGAYDIKTADLFQPKRITDFKAIQDTESIILKWSQPQKGSFEISGYNIYRGKSADTLQLLVFLPAGKMVYEDLEVEPAIKYFYRIRAIDVKNNEAPQSDLSSAVAMPIPRTGLVLMPTAYRNDIYSNMGLNADMLFSYYIGNLYESHSDVLLKNDSRLFTKVGTWLLTGDIKATVFNDFDSIPSLGAGYMYTVLFQDQIGSSETTGLSKSINISESGSLITFQGVYGAISKKTLWDLHLHGGFMYGTQANFLPYLTNYIYTDDWKKSNQSYYLGASKKLFRKVGVKLEYVVPGGGVNKTYFMPNMYIVNSHIDSFINFDVGYFHFDGGYAWLGYISYRFTVYPSPYK